MIVAVASGSGKTVFTKQVLRSADVEFEKKFWFYFEWQEGYRDCTDVTFVSGMPFSLDSYLESTAGPKLVVFDDMIDDPVRQQRDDCADVHTETLPSERQRLVDSARARSCATPTSTRSTWCCFAIPETRVSLDTLRYTTLYISNR